MLKFLPELRNRFLCSIGPEGGGSDSGGGSAPGGAGSSAASPSAPSATPSGPTSSPASPGSSSASTPPSGVAAPSAASPSAEGGVDVLDFSAIFGESGEPAVIPPTVATPPTPQAVDPLKPPVSAEPPKPAAVVPPQAGPAVVATPGQTPTASEAAAQAAVPQLDPSDPLSIAAHLTQHKDAAIAHIAAKLFKLSPEDIEALEADTVGTVPRLLARTFVELQTTMLTQMSRLVPAIIQRQTELTRRNGEAMNEFFKRWPALNQAAHGDLVTRYAIGYRQMHPQDTKEQMFENLGPLIMMAARVVPGAVQVSGSPAAPGSRPHQASPFVPAGSGAAEPINAQEMSSIEAMFAEQP